MIKLGMTAIVLACCAQQSAAQQNPHTAHQHPSLRLAQAAYPQPSPKTSQDKVALIKEALTAAPSILTDSVTIKDWDGTLLRAGKDDFTCFPTHPDKRVKDEKEPMCLDKAWLAWGDAWMNKKPFKAEAFGIAYMMAGDSGASNTDPFASGKTADNQWIVEGPHMMLLIPDETQLNGLPTNPQQGGPYIMWKGTPYAHVMVPLGARPKQ